MSLRRPRLCEGCAPGRAGALTSWNPGGTPEAEKWSGRLDSNQRPPAPKQKIDIMSIQAIMKPVRRCAKCGYRQLVTEASSECPYEVAGLARIILHHVEVTRCPKCGDCDAAVCEIESLQRAIAHAVISKRARLTPGEIRFLRKHLRWSGLELSIHMGATSETVSRWENGRTPMGVTADRLLRLLVALSAGGVEFSLGQFRMVARGEPRATRIDVEFRDGQWYPITQSSTEL
jgi:putative zinc finger/helix-turn-helix YgiT family protein